MKLVVGFSLWPLLCWSTFLLYLICWVFIMKESLILSNAFNTSIEIIRIFILHSVNVGIPLVDLYIWDHCFIPGINPTWSWCRILLMCCWILFANILLRTFASIFIKNMDLKFSSLAVPFFGLIQWIWKCSFLLKFLGRF